MATVKYSRQREAIKNFLMSRKATRLLRLYMNMF